MAYNFIVCNGEQQHLLSPRLLGWLPEDHTGWFINRCTACFYIGHAVGADDTLSVYEGYDPDQLGEKK